MSLDLDFQTLNEDADHLATCAARGIAVDTPGVSVVVARWGLDTPMVGREGFGDAVNGMVRSGVYGTADASKRILLRFRDWSAAYGKEYADKLKELTNKAAFLERRAEGLKRRRDLTKTLTGESEVDTGRWTSKVCLEDRVNVRACCELSDNMGKLEDMVKKYTVLVRSVARGQQVRDDALRPLGRSTNWAIKRSAGILGIVNPFGKVEAYPLPGNVVVVEHGKKVDFAVARDGNYGHTVPKLSLDEIDDALSAAFTFARELKQRGVKRGVFSYSGINDELEAMQRELDDLEGDELKEATLRFRNAVKIEDAICTAFVRCAEGLLDYCAASLKS